MAKRKVTYLIDVDETGAITGTRRVEKGFEDVDKTAKKTSSNLEKYAARAGTALVAGLGLAFAAASRRAVQQGREFESQLASLEAITGITGRQLERLGKRSLELSKIYGTSASNIIEANKLVASQLAEKIDFGTEAGFQTLQKVSEQAVVLARAAGIELSEAVDTTTSVINQFNLSAEESERVINTLAAGSKFGAAEVPAIGRALVNAGSAAAGANQQIETVNGAIQVLAANGQVGERAGTALRAIFLRLQTSAKELADAGISDVNIESNGLVHTLKQLEPLLEDTAAMKKIFGEEAINAASILIRQADSVESLTEKVTGTKVAYEQAEVQLDTFDGTLERLWTSIDANLIPAFQSNEGIMRDGLEVLITWVDETGNLIREVNRLSTGMGSLSAITHTLIDLADRNDPFQFLSRLRDGAVWAGILEGRQNFDDLFKTIDAGTQQIEGRITTLQDELDHFFTQQKDTEEGSDLWQWYEDGINRAGGELQNLQRVFQSNLAHLKIQRREVEYGSYAWAEITEEINQAEHALSMLASVSSRPDLPSNNDDENEDEAAGVASIAQQVKDLKASYEELINMPNLDDAGIFKAVGIAERIQEMETLLEKRREAARPLDLSDPMDITTIGDDITSDADRMGNEVTDEERAAHAERMAMIDSQKTAEIEAQQDAATATRKAQEEKMRAYGEASAQAILYSDNVRDAAKNVIKALTSEIITRAILAAFQPPTPASLVLAPVLAAGATRLIGSLIPDFGLGGLAHGPSHEQGGIYGMIDGKPALELEGGEAIINKKSTRMFLGSLSAINQAGGGVPLAREGALTLNAIPRGGDPLPVAGGGEGSLENVLSDLTRLLSRGIKAEMDVRRMDEELSDYQFEQKRIGN